MCATYKGFFPFFCLHCSWRERKHVTIWDPSRKFSGQKYLSISLEGENEKGTRRGDRWNHEAVFMSGQVPWRQPLAKNKSPTLWFPYQCRQPVLRCTVPTWPHAEVWSSSQTEDLDQRFHCGFSGHLAHLSKNGPQWVIQGAGQQRFIPLTTCYRLSFHYSL